MHSQPDPELAGVAELSQVGNNQWETLIQMILSEE
jgi:hypothetical protein